MATPREALTDLVRSQVLAYSMRLNVQHAGPQLQALSASSALALDSFATAVRVCSLPACLARLTLCMQRTIGAAFITDLPGPVSSAQLAAAPIAAAVSAVEWSLGAQRSEAPARPLSNEVLTSSVCQWHHRADRVRLSHAGSHTERVRILPCGPVVRL